MTPEEKAYAKGRIDAAGASIMLIAIVALGIGVYVGIKYKKIEK